MSFFHRLRKDDDEKEDLSGLIEAPSLVRVPLSEPRFSPAQHLLSSRVGFAFWVEFFDCEGRKLDEFSQGMFRAVKHTDPDFLARRYAIRRMARSNTGRPVFNILPYKSTKVCDGYHLFVVTIDSHENWQPGINAAGYLAGRNYYESTVASLHFRHLTNYFSGLRS